MNSHPLSVKDLFLRYGGYSLCFGCRSEESIIARRSCRDVNECTKISIQKERNSERLYLEFVCDKYGHRQDLAKEVTIPLDVAVLLMLEIQPPEKAAKAILKYVEAIGVKK